MAEFESPLMKVSEVSRSILHEKPAATYAKIANHVFPPGVVVKLGERSYRFHRQKLMEWIENGGKVAA
jgi:hypothetical protein